MKYIGSQVGGTFTDLWAADDSGKSQFFRSPTRSYFISGMVDAVRLAADAYRLKFEKSALASKSLDTDRPVGLNAQFHVRAAMTVIVTILGFADLLEIRRIRRQTSGSVKRRSLTSLATTNSGRQFLAKPLLKVESGSMPMAPS